MLVLQLNKGNTMGAGRKKSELKMKRKAAQAKKKSKLKAKINAKK